MKRTCPPEVDSVFRSYPDTIRGKLLFLRELIYETAQEVDGVGALEETLKWSEPAYLAKGGGTIRIGWKKSVVRTTEPMQGYGAVIRQLRVTNRAT